MRHCLDVEKNVCDSIIGTLLNIPDKTKNIVKTRLDLVEMCIHEQLTSGKGAAYLFTVGMPYFV